MAHTPFTSSLVLPALAAAAPLPAPLQATLCGADVPLALLPVRLETRFFAQAGGASELRVRVYPDKISIAAHAADLTPAEQMWGRHYWEQDWRAGNDETLRAAAWRQFATRYEPTRAAWIRRLLQPLNPAQRPAAPTPPEHALDPAPQFPAAPVTPEGEAAWRVAAQAMLLPDRWIAIVQSGGRAALAVEGAPIARDKPLQVGPDPQADKPAQPGRPPAVPGIPGDQPAIDPGMRWMVDFDAAEQAGMGLRIPVPASVLAAGIEALFVLGVDTTTAPLDGAARAAALLDAHHYTDGLAFVRPGTPSNNTAERRAGYRSDDPGREQSLADEVLQTAAPADDTNAQRLGRALGLPPDHIETTLGRIGQAQQRPEADARHMNTALWQATWGYFLSNMVGFDGTGLTLDHLDWARRHFIDRVRSAGPLPALRCGRQPYGILPVTSLDAWQPLASATASPDAARQAWLRGLLLRLRDNVWRPRLGSVPRVGRRQAPVDADADLAEVMRTEAVSSRYNTRAVLGRHLYQHLHAFAGTDLQANGFIATHDALTGGILQRLGFPWHARLSRAVHALNAYPLNVPLVQAGEVSPWRKLEPDYIAALLGQADIAALVTLAPAGGPSLLQALLRHALLLEIAHAAALIGAAEPGASATALLRDAELVDLVTAAAPTFHWQRQLDRAIAPVTGTQTLRQYLQMHLQGLLPFSTPPVRALGEFRASLAHLQQLDSEALQLQMQGTLDLASHRLDAWVTSLATQRLDELRSRTPQGLRVGGYGWVENLRPAAAAPAVAPPPGEAGSPLAALPGDSGFIHAPSAAHAATAALLRNAHLGAGGVPQPNGPFALDLSSRRMREAAQLLDGVRQGQPLGALLGYRFERRLHELERDDLIAMFRNLHPLAAGRLETSTGVSAESIAAHNVVDGLALHQRWRSDAAGVRRAVQVRLTSIGHPAALVGAYVNAVAAELDALDEVIDALGDALTAEAAYQIVRGNTARTAGTLQAVAQGDAPPPELEVARMPRSGAALTHRVLVLFSGAAPATPGWAAPAKSPRALAEPMLNAWAARLLGDPRKVRCTVQRLAEGSDAVVETRSLLLSELQLAPLDVVYGVPAQAATRQGGTQPGDVEQLVLYHARRTATGSSPQARWRVQHERPADLKAGEITLLDVLEQAGTARRLLAGARSADADDLNPPERASAGTLDLAELESRIAKAANGLNAAHKALDTLARQGAAADPEALRAALLRLVAYGIGAALPNPPTGTDNASRAALLLQAAGVLKESRARIDQGTALAAQAAPADPRAHRGHLDERLRAMFGSGFVALPRFACANAAELAAGLAGSRALLGEDPLAAHTWMGRSARVREPVARLHQVLCGAEVLAVGDKANLSVVQLPPRADGGPDRWVGLPPLPDTAIDAGRLSLVLQLPAPVDTAQPLAALLVDEWIDHVPSRSETTALAFQYNPPDTCAPQSVLLAVPPADGQGWTVAGLHRVLQETLDLARLRGVDTESLGEVAHYLPALFYAFNTGNQPVTVSTDFAALTR